jgi:hypothetical protein
MSAARHTPTPWRFVPWHVAEGPSEVRAPEGWLLCTTSGDADAEFITIACNAHDDLVAALEHCLREHGGFFLAGESERLARAALAKARGEP